MAQHDSTKPKQSRSVVRKSQISGKAIKKERLNVDSVYKSNILPNNRVADPGGFYSDLDPALEKTPDPDLIFEKISGSDPRKKRDTDPTLFCPIILTFYFFVRHNSQHN